MSIRTLVTIGPSSLKKDVILNIENKDVYVFRINLSHTAIEDLADVINEIRKITKIPICLDSEGAQIRNHKMVNGDVQFKKGEIVKIHFEEIEGDSYNISFSPVGVARQLRIDDEIKIDFNSVRLKVIEINNSHCLAEVIVSGTVGSNKAADVNRNINLEAITKKDREAISIGRKNGIQHFALSFAGSSMHVKFMRELTGSRSKIISKIESIQGLLNLNQIIDASDEILIDRGDLSRQVSLEKIPFMQRRIISLSRSKGVPVYVATNLLESMIKSPEPSRAEINDVVSSLLMGANGLVLAAETAIGNYPVEAVEMIQKLITQYDRWTPNTSIIELLENGIISNPKDQLTAN